MKPSPESEDDWRILREKIIELGEHSDLKSYDPQLLNRLAALEAEKERLAAALRSMGEALITTDPQGIIVFFNAAAERMTGFAPEQVLGARLGDLIQFIDEKSHEPCPDPIGVILESGAPFQMDKQCLRNLQDGSLRAIAFHGAPVRSREGKTTGVVLELRDLTELDRSHEALLDRQAKLDSIFRAAPVGIGVVVNRILIQVNVRLCELVGYSPDELLGKNTRLFYSTQREYEAVGEAYRQLVEGSRGATEARWRRKDGTAIDVLLNSALLVPGDLRSGVLFTVLDITERKRAEEALRESEERYRLLFEVNPHPMWVYDLETLAFLAVNDTAIQHYGYSREEFLSMTLRDIRPPEDLPQLMTNISAGRYSLDQSTGWRHRKKSGEIIDVELTSRLQQFMGRPAALVLATNVTERRRAEEALQSAQRMLRLVLDTIPVRVFWKDRASVYLGCNHLFALDAGLRFPEEIIGRNDFELSWKDQAESFRADDRMVIESGEAKLGYEENQTTLDGKNLWVRASKIPLRNAQGQIMGILGSYEDITDRKLAEQERMDLEQQMLHAQKLESLGVLAGGIAHDFNNLLMAILGNAELVLLDLAPKSSAHACMCEIEKASRRAAELCRQMLAYSGKGRFVVEPVNLSRLVQEMAPMLEASVSKKATLRYNLVQDLPAIWADATQMQQIVMNLIVNASESLGDKSGDISVSTGVMECDRSYLAGTFMDERLSEGSYVYLEVADTGVGMTAGTKAKIFDPFFTTKFTGRGLGLAAVLGIVRGHKGAIRVHSEPGQGSTFRVLFPASSELVPNQETEARTSEGRGSGTILIVDDEETVRVLAAKMVEHCGFSVLTAEDGREALRIFRSHPGEIDGVLLDLTMPHMDGEETFRELRLLRPDVRVILVSGYNEQEATQHFVGKGLVGFLQKPFQMSALHEKLKEFLGQRRSDQTSGF